jgi:hypothetical protein
MWFPCLTDREKRRLLFFFLCVIFKHLSYRPLMVCIFQASLKFIAVKARKSARAQPFKCKIEYPFLFFLLPNFYIHRRIMIRVVYFLLFGTTLYYTWISHLGRESVAIQNRIRSSCRLKLSVSLLVFIGQPINGPCIYHQKKRTTCYNCLGCFSLTNIFFFLPFHFDIVYLLFRDKNS